MNSRRKFITQSLGLAAGTALAPFLSSANSIPKPTMNLKEKLNVTLPSNYGLGGVAIGNGFRPTSDEQAQKALEGAWEAGVRFFDTSPFYGFGISERRFGRFLHNKNRNEYILATKVGRLLKPAKEAPSNGTWKEASPFTFEYDYSAEGVRRSIEDSLQRLGINSIDIVFIHDLSPENADMKDNWMDYFQVAAKGAMPELTKMREEGLIKGWGLGVNRIEPILETLKVAEPDICLSATQYSLMYHEDALKRLFPACEEKGVDIVSGAALNAGFLAGIDRYNYWGEMPEGYKEKRARMKEIAEKHGTDLRTAALQFAAAPKVVKAVIPGTRYPEQARENVESMKVKIPSDLWKELKEKKLISQHAPEPL
ncbi:aldo/keto reductase [Pleomorphovibrio marinus]|uniref:aldo/keto reductase n=1 Tax=Pleomorphovibrio marinus TaxID=2164132 RepID=UPI000E0C29BC|nr:aldo/keto reductase [Pleomorphovibrio marinus]